MSARTLASTAEYLLDPTGFVDRRIRFDQGFFRAETLPYGREIFVTDPSLARAIFAAPDLHGGLANVAHRVAVGERSVSSLDGAAHQERRRLLGPVLAAGRAALAAPRAHARTRRALSDAPEEACFSVDPLIRRIVMEGMLEASFGVLDDDVHALGSAFAELVETGAGRLGQLGIMPGLQRDFPGSPWRAFRRKLAAIDGAIYRQVDRVDQRDPSSGTTPGGLCAALRRAKDDHGRALPRAAVRDDLFTLLGAGYETTATSILWAFLHIQRHEPTRRAILEGDEACLDRAIRESLRRTPTLPTVRRVAVAPFEHGRLEIAAGETVVLAIDALHRDPAVFVHPERFDPTRGHDPRSSFAFGGGVRTCPGAALAHAQMRGVLAALIPAVVSVGAAAPRPVFRGATLAPAAPVYVRRARG